MIRHYLKHVAKGSSKSLAGLLMLAGVSAMLPSQALAEPHLILHFTDGSTTGFVVAEKPHVSFSDSKLLVRSNDITTDYDIATVRKFEFGDMVAIDAPALPGTATRFCYTDHNNLSASGLKAGELLRLVALDGRVAATVRADADGNLALDLSDLPTGIYVVSVETSAKNFKIKH